MPYSYPFWDDSNQHTHHLLSSPMYHLCFPIFFTWYMGDLGTKRGRHPIPAGDLQCAMSREGIEPPTR